MAPMTKQPTHPGASKGGRGRLMDVFHRSVLKAFHPRRRPSSTSRANAEDQEGLISHRKFSIASVSETQLQLLSSQGRGYDGSVSVSSRHASRSEATQKAENPKKSSSRPISDTAFSYTRHGVASIEFNDHSLCYLSDAVRASIAATGLFDCNLDTLAYFLNRALAEEELNNPTINFETIKNARLDKLLTDIISCAERGTIGSAASFELASAAEALQRSWRSRHRSQCFMIDEIRTIELATTGRLKGVSFVDPAVEQTPTGSLWTAVDVHPCASEESVGNLSFALRSWWLNIACAHRDGLVAHEDEMPTVRSGGDSSVLPLLTGREEITGVEATNYIAVGPYKKIHGRLVSKVGKHLHVLRGYELRSEYAPVAGLRYDGLWKITRHSHRFDTTIGEYRFELGLKRAPQQIWPWQVALKTPTPSQLDDWQLFEKLEVEKIRQSNGEHSALAHKIEKDQERMKREQWRRVWSFRSSISGMPKSSMKSTNSAITDGSESIQARVEKSVNWIREAAGSSGSRTPGSTQ
ncbi:hypothetical protein B0T19DRAFT_104572 [Cercophora scortea]|uniref:YDG domain-containing protein n=1 Tax=Cercophora scortea TaxID=314031 RepID=A0AAE0IWK9_9PEZI|nr:hypothetical protein B0T19DRAFT_104572 [Cercophora scortea]